MSASLDERLKALSAFPPRVIASHLDEDMEVEFQLTFYPHLNAFKVHRSDEPDLNPRLPVLTFSYTGFINGEIALNKANRMDRVILALKAEWDKISDEEKSDFYDNIPLNSLFMGAHSPTN